MKVIFLDIDGVLNCENTFKKANSRIRTKMICGDKVAELRNIIDSTGAKVVLSSSWRIGMRMETEKELGKYGIDIYDCTPYIEAVRGLEIKEWLSRNKDVSSFVILDDEVYDMEEYVASGKVVQTSFRGSGLTPEHAEMAIRILGD